MQNLFIEENDVIEIKIVVATDKEGTVFCDTSESSLREGLKEIKANIEDYDIQEYIANFKKPSFGDSMGLYDSVFTTNGKSVTFNPVVARFRKIILLIKDWNFSGDFVKPTEKEIRKLHPVVAAVIGNKLDEETGGMLG